MAVLMLATCLFIDNENMSSKVHFVGNLKMVFIMVYSGMAYWWSIVIWWLFNGAFVMVC
jgi:hypothetical protein